MPNATLTFDLTVSSDDIVAAVECALKSDLDPAHRVGKVEVIHSKRLVLTEAHWGALRSALEVAWADDDHPIFDTPEGSALAKEVAEVFGAVIFSGDSSCHER